MELAHSSHRRESLDGVRVLVVEDDFLIALDVEQCLQEAGAAVVGPAANVDKALELANSEKLSCALLDVRLGSGSSLPIALYLRDHDVPFALYTGQAPDELDEPWPLCEVLSKPISTEELVAAVARMANSCIVDKTDGKGKEDTERVA